MLPINESRISPTAACRHPRLAVDGRPLSMPALYRKMTGAGIRGLDGKRHKIETELGARGTLVTTSEAIERFIRAINEGGESNPPQPAGVNLAPRRPSGGASKQLAAAECDAIGI